MRRHYESQSQLLRPEALVYRIFAFMQLMVDLKTNDIMMIQVAYDLYDLLEHKMKYPFQKEWMNAIGEVAKELEDDYFKSLKPKRGEYLYSDSAATNPKYSAKKGTQIFWAETLAHFKHVGGYKAVFFRSTNPKTTKAMINIGAEMLQTLPLRRE